MDEDHALQAKKAVEIFGRAARLSFGDEIITLILFGSHSRDEARPESDVDIAVVFKDIIDRTAVRNDLADIAYDATVETYIDVHPLPVSLEERTHPERHNNQPLIRAIKHDGKIIAA
jgi:predicted nucleotidyltransferase